METILINNDSISIFQDNKPEKNFEYDYIFDTKSTQQDVYEEVTLLIRPVACFRDPAGDIFPHGDRSAHHLFLRRADRRPEFVHLYVRSGGSLAGGREAYLPQEGGSAGVRCRRGAWSNLCGRPEGVQCLRLRHQQHLHDAGRLRILDRGGMDNARRGSPFDFLEPDLPLRTIPYQVGCTRGHRGHCRD